MDCHMLPISYQPADFWTDVVGQVETSFVENTILAQIEAVRQSTYSSFSLRRLFELLGRGGMRAVVLIDEFEVLLHHSNFNTAEFFGALRSLAIQTDGLALLTASRMPIGEMNRRSQELNPFGSPFFNNLIEVRLQPMRMAEVEQLIDQMLDGTGVVFSPEDRAYIVHATGRHPFLVQIAAAALFETIGQKSSNIDKYNEADRRMRSLAAAHFEDVWHEMAPNLKQVALTLALAETHNNDSGSKQSERLDPYDWEMRELSERGLIEPTTDVHCAVWRGERWRIGAGSFTHWLIDSGKWTEIDPPKIQPKLTTAERSAQIAALREQMTTRRRRLQILEEQAATFGPIVPPAIVLQIEDTRREIEADQRELERLGGRS